MISWLRAWWKRRGEAACVRGDHAWKAITALESLNGKEGMDILVAASVMSYYDHAVCQRCGKRGKRVSMR